MSITRVCCACGEPSTDDGNEFSLCCQAELCDRHTLDDWEIGDRVDWFFFRNARFMGLFDENRVLLVSDNGDERRIYTDLFLRRAIKLEVGNE